MVTVASFVVGACVGSAVLAVWRIFVMHALLWYLTCPLNCGAVVDGAVVDGAVVDGAVVGVAVVLVLCLC